MAENMCPNCHGPVETMPWCPGHRKRTSSQVLKVCVPTCGQATMYLCDNPDTECYWSYIDRYNSRNDDAKENELKRPQWL